MVDSETGDEVEQANIIKGYEVAKDEHIELDPEELEAVTIESKRTIEIEEFVPKALADFWQLAEHKLGETTFTHFADGTAHKNRMQGNDFIASLMYTRGVTCFNCHDPHGTENPGMVREPGNGLCLECHGPNGQNGPHAATIEQHTHHAAGSPGSECIACHMPKVAETIGDVKVRSHTFRFVWPARRLGRFALRLRTAAGVPGIGGSDADVC